MDKIVYVGPDHSVEIIQQHLGDFFEVIYVEPTPESFLPEFKSCTVFLDASMKVPIDEAMIAGATKLKLVVTATTGASHIDDKALESRNIPLLTLKGQVDLLSSLTPAAELNWSLIMSCARKLKGAFQHVDAAGWNRVDFPGVLLKGKTIGLVGMGRLGSWTARYANAFGMDILGYDPYVKEFPEYVEKASLEQIMEKSDVVSIHVHLSDDTAGMIDKDLIVRFKKGAIFVNTSRGELTDENALVDSLKNGQLGAVGVDVLSNEPNIEQNPLWIYSQDNNNVVITPHIGGFCPDAVDKVVGFSCTRILSYFNNK